MDSSILNGLVSLWGAEIQDVRGFLLSPSKVIRITEEDPWILASSISGISWIRVSLDLNPLFYREGDAVTIYYSADLENDPLSEAKTVCLPLNGDGSVTKTIQIPETSRFLRFDLTERKGDIPIRRLRIECFESNMDLFEHSFPPSSDGKGIIILSHDLSKSGAPILAYDIASELKKRRISLIVFFLSSSSRELEESYLSSSIPVYPLFFTEDPSAEPSERRVTQTNVMLKWLYENGYKFAILNTVVSGNWAGMFKQAGFRVTTLIHESANTIHVYGWRFFLAEAAQFSDTIVFPCDSILEEDSEFVHGFNGKVAIRPQGIRFKQIKHYSDLAQSVFTELGIKDDETLVLSAGTICLRKGIDLFVSACAAMLRQSDNCKQYRFIWIGNGSEEIKRWMEVQIARSSMKDHVHIVPFMDPAKYRRILKRANIFWSTSRADTFPSVVLEAMHENVPVLAFRNAGGVNTILAKNRGILIDDFSPDSLAYESLRLLKNNRLHDSIVQSARKWTLDNMQFDRYVDDLLTIVYDNEVIKPEFAANILSTWNNRSEGSLNPTIGATVPVGEIERANDARLKSSILHPRGFLKRRVPALLDTSIFTDNADDHIIMEYCNKACKSALSTTKFDRFPTHVYDPSLETIRGRTTILCGTNLIYTQMEESTQWAFPRDLTNFSNLYMLGVGMQDVGTDLPFSEYSIRLLRYLLNNGNIHSVRDSYTKDRLERIGINNIVNTSCPAMWALTPDHCQLIPRKKGRYCVTTLNQFDPNPSADSFMVNTLTELYDRVYLWLQGPHDYHQCVKGVIDPTSVTILPSRLSALDEALSAPHTDYVGVGLHAGIRALNHRCRTLVVAIDNRSRHIAQDTNLPIIERKTLYAELAPWIESPHEISISLPTEAIEAWKSQF